jgi:hypothetical protein
MVKNSLIQVKVLFVWGKSGEHFCVLVRESKRILGCYLMSYTRL